jgi:hypothetical protein
MENALTVRGGGSGIGVFYGSEGDIMLGSVRCVVMVEVRIDFFVKGFAVGSIKVTGAFPGLPDVREDVIPSESFGVGFEGLEFLDGCLPGALLGGVGFDGSEEVVDVCHAGMYLPCFPL